MSLPGDSNRHGHYHGHPDPAGPDGCSFAPVRAHLHIAGQARCATLPGYVQQAADRSSAPPGKSALLHT